VITTYHKALINVKAYLPDDKEIIKIIKLCNLRNDEKNWKIWYDDLGNKLTFSDKKTIIIKQDDNFIIKNIHHKLHPKNIIKKSKLLLINKNDNVFYCLFYLDNHLKLSIYKDDNWIENQPPLNIGIDNIRHLIQNANVDDYKEITDNNIIIIKLPSSKVVFDTEYKQILEKLGI